MIVIGLNDQLKPFLYDMETKSHVTKGQITHVSYACFRDSSKEQVMHYISDFDCSDNVKSFTIKTPKNYSKFSGFYYGPDQENGEINADIFVWTELYSIIQNLDIQGIEDEDYREYRWFRFVEKFRNEYFVFPLHLLDAYLRDILKIKRKHTLLSKTMSDWISLPESNKNILVKSASKR